MEYEGHSMPGKKYPVLCWGHHELQKQHGVTTYLISANQQRPFAGAAYNAIFNTWRRSRAQFLYVVPPFVAAYYVLDWAEKRNKYLNAKEGRMNERG